jgi:hypothetical protein
MYDIFTGGDRFFLELHNSTRSSPQVNYSPFGCWVQNSTSTENFYLEAFDSSQSNQTSNSIEIAGGWAFLWSNNSADNRCDGFAYKWPPSAPQVFYTYL